MEEEEAGEAVSHSYNDYFEEGEVLPEEPMIVELDPVGENEVQTEEPDPNNISELVRIVNPKRSTAQKKKVKKSTNEVQPTDGPKRIFRSQKHIDRVAKRLSQSKAKKSPPEEPADPVRKASADPKTFERLYEQSKQKQAKQQELQLQFETEEQKQIEQHMTKTCKRSVSLVSDQLSRYLHSLFNGEDEIDSASLNATLRDLGLLGPREDLVNAPAVEHQSQRWRKENDRFDTQAIIASLEAAINAAKPTTFQIFVKQKIMIAIANGSKLKKQTEQIPEASPTKQMQKETFDRLTRVRQSDISKKPVNHPKRHKFIPKICLDDQLPEIHPSEVTKGILENSELGRLPLRERDEILSERRADRIRKLEEAEARRHSRQEKPHPMPVLPPDMKEKLEERKERIRNKPPDGPTFRPQVTKYEDFLKVRQTMFHARSRPEGWDASVTRLRAAHEQFLQHKEEHANGIDLLRIRNSSRVREREDD
jgi:hypothetical protein